MRSGFFSSLVNESIVNCLNCTSNDDLLHLRCWIRFCLPNIRAQVFWFLAIRSDKLSWSSISKHTSILGCAREFCHHTRTMPRHANQSRKGSNLQWIDRNRMTFIRNESVGTTTFSIYQLQSCLTENDTRYRLLWLFGCHGKVGGKIQRSYGRKNMKQCALCAMNR